MQCRVVYEMQGGNEVANEILTVKVLSSKFERIC